MAENASPCDEVLLERLRHAALAEVDALVDIITDFGGGRAGLDTDIKIKLVMARHDSGDKKYPLEMLQLLALELQQFGGHSVVNAARRWRNRPAVSYAEIVDDVYRKLNGASDTNKIISQKEREIALALFGAEWNDLPFSERYERSTSIRVLSGLFDIKSAMSIGKTGGITGLPAGASAALFVTANIGARFNPLGMLATVGLGLHSAVSEAYRVTVPFIAQLGWIRLRQESQKRSGSPEASADAPVVPVHADSALTVQDNTGATLMKLSILSDIRVPTGTEIPSEKIGALNPLLSNIPNLAALAEQQRGNYVLCSLPFDTLAKSASVEGGVRGWVREGGRITEQANLFSPDGLQSVLISGAAWNALSSAVGQKHLHDINEKLNAIKRQLDAVREDLESLRWDKLKGLVAYVQSLLDHFPSEGITPQALNQLENHQVLMIELESYFQTKMKDELKVASAMKTDKIVGSETVRTELATSLVRLHQWVQGYTQIIQVRMVSLGLLHLGQPLERYRQSAADLTDSLGELSKMAVRSAQIYNAQMAMSKSPLSEIPADVAGKFSEQMQALQSELRSGPEGTRQLHNTLFNNAERSMLLYVEGGKISNAQLLS